MKETSEDLSNDKIDESQPQIEEALYRIYECKANKAKILDIRNLDLVELPPQLFELDFIEILILKNNPLEKLSDDIECLTSLKKISLSGFKFHQLPSSFANLIKIEDIYISSNTITEFPKKILSLNKLKYLNLSECNITELPKELDSIETLRYLWLSNNPISTIDHLSNLLNRLTELSVIATKITQFDFLRELHKIKRLSIGGKNLPKIHKELFELQTLERFDIFDAKIQAIPEEIEKLKKLKELFFYKLQIRELPKSLGSLKRLTKFSVLNSKLETLPASIGDLQNLETLRLYDNSLKEIPAEIGKLSALKELNLSDNELVSLPIEIGNLLNLKSLDLDNNKLVDLPAELSKLEKLKKISAFGNDSLTSPPKDVVAKGTKAILAYLKDLAEEVKVWSSRLVIVGEGQVGKSCLLDALNNKPFDKGKPTTHALNLSQLTFYHPKKECSMNLNVWDFGGQDIYHATHQFYLTNHSLFLLVWSARSGYDSGKIYKWLETISALAPDSSIFIVATNSSDRGADLPKGDILNLYPDKVIFFEVDNETGKGISNLKEKIRLKAASLKYMGIVRPRSWINSSQEIKNTEEQYVNKCDLFKIFEKNGVAKNSYESLACYLHDLGEILYYPDEEELKETIIIKPEWVSLQIAKILDSEILSENEGFLDKKLMQELWSDIDTVLHGKLITLMEKFDLSYKTKDDKEISLIVEKLKFEEHEDYLELWTKFKGNNQIVFKYQLDTIPAGIPTWFIARTHRFSMKVHWRYGVLLKDTEEKHMALLTVSPERKEIWLKVKGDMPYYFFAQLRDTLELTFSRFEGLKRPAYVPCPGHNGNSCNHLFDLKQLEKRISLKPPKKNVECPEEIEDIDVMKLLFGLSFAPNNEDLVEKFRIEVEKVIREQNSLQTDELVKFTQLEFIKSYQAAQEIADVTCPNIFTLKEIKSDIKSVKLHNRYKLQLYCQMPGCNHSIGEPYEITVPKEWIMAIAPYYNKMLKTLKYTLPLVVPGTNAVLGDLELDDYKPIAVSLKEYGKMMNEYESDYANLNESSNNTDTNIRYIRKLLETIDPQQKWAGLKRLVSPEGHILWLCEQHYLEYKR